MRPLLIALIVLIASLLSCGHPPQDPQTIVRIKEHLDLEYPWELESFQGNWDGGSTGGVFLGANDSRVDFAWGPGAIKVRSDERRRLFLGVRYWSEPGGRRVRPGSPEERALVDAISIWAGEQIPPQLQEEYLATYYDPGNPVQDRRTRFHSLSTEQERAIQALWLVREIEREAQYEAQIDSSIWNHPDLRAYLSFWDSSFDDLGPGSFQVVATVDLPRGRVISSSEYPIPWDACQQVVPASPDSLWGADYFPFQLCGTAGNLIHCKGPDSGLHLVDLATGQREYIYHWGTGCWLQVGVWIDSSRFLLVGTADTGPVHETWNLYAHLFDFHTRNHTRLLGPMIPVAARHRGSYHNSWTDWREERFPDVKWR